MHPVKAKETIMQCLTALTLEGTREGARLAPPNGFSSAGLLNFLLSKNLVISAMGLSFLAGCAFCMSEFLKGLFYVRQTRAK